MPFQAIVFDLDETLVDSKGSIVGFYRDLFADLSLAFPEGEEGERFFYTRSKPEIWARHFADPALAARVEAWIARRDFAASLPRIHLKPRARETLEWCGARYLVALVTNRGPSTRPLLDHLDIAKYFHVIYAADDMERLKPDPWVLEQIVREMSIAPAELVFVGDSAHDMSCARAAGVKAVGLGDTWRVGEARPDWELPGLDGLVGLLERIDPPVDALTVESPRERR